MTSTELQLVTSKLNSFQQTMCLLLWLLQSAQFLCEHAQLLNLSLLHLLFHCRVLLDPEAP